MKKKIITIVFILAIVLLLNLWNEKAYAAISKTRYTMVTTEAEFKAGTGEAESDALSQLKEFGYTGAMQDEMRWQVDIKLCINALDFYDINKNEKYWKVFINNKEFLSNLKYSDIVNNFACEVEELSKDDIKKKIQDSKSNKDDVEIASYTAVIIAEKDLSNKGVSNNATGNSTAGIKIDLIEVYTGENISEGQSRKVKSENTSIAAVDGTEKKDMGIIEKILAEIVIEGLDLLRYLPDALQMILNSLETGNVTERLTWKYDQIKNDNDKNKYANVNNTAESKISTNALLGPYPVPGDKYEFKKDTEIPVIPVDIYTYSIGKINIFDTNFLTGQNDVDENGNLIHNSIWLFIRNFVSAIIHIIIYFAAAFLLATLIWRGILLVWKSLTPVEKKEQIEGIKDFAISLIMLVGVVVIMGISIFLSRSIFNDIKPQESMEMPLRISVNGNANYSFSTNYVGYARYLTEIKNPEELGTKCLAFAEYTGLVLLNLAFTIIMAIRMFNLIKLSIIGPLLAIGKALNKNEILKYTFKSWTIQYAVWSGIQIVIALIYRGIIFIES